MTMHNGRELNVKKGKQGFQETEKHDSSISLGALQEDLGETDEDWNYYAEDEYDDWETPDYVTDGGPGVVALPPDIRKSLEKDYVFRPAHRSDFKNYHGRPGTPDPDKQAKSAYAHDMQVWKDRKNRD